MAFGRRQQLTVFLRALPRALRMLPGMRGVKECVLSQMIIDLEYKNRRQRGSKTHEPGHGVERKKAEKHGNHNCREQSPEEHSAQGERKELQEPYKQGAGNKFDHEQRPLRIGFNAYIV